MGTSRPPRPQAPVMIAGEWGPGDDAASPTSLSEACLVTIGAHLRDYYKHLTDEPLPESFIEIVDRFDKQRTETDEAAGWPFTSGRLGTR
jgi:Anti-sigma factor NepR